MNYAAFQIARNANLETRLQGHLLFWMATYASEDNEAWPSVETLAVKLKASARTIQRNLSALVRQGYLAVLRHGSGRGRSTVYRVTAPAGARPPAQRGDDCEVSLGKKGDTGAGVSAGKGDIRATERVTSGAEKGDTGAAQSIKDIRMEEKPYAQAREGAPPFDQHAGFTAFWTAYPDRCPRKNSRDVAWRRYRKSITTRSEHDHLMAALAADCASRGWRAEGGRYIPSPVSWLGKRRWKGEGKSTALEAGCAGRALEGAARPKSSEGCTVVSMDWMARQRAYFEGIGLKGAELERTLAEALAIMAGDDEPAASGGPRLHGN